MFTFNADENHLIARLDTRLKIACTAIILVLVLSCRSFSFPLLIAALSLFLCRSMKVPRRAFLRRFSEPMFIVCVLILIKTLWAGNGDVFTVSFMGFEFSGYREGFFDGLRMAARITGAVSIVAVLGFSTPFGEFLAGLSWFKVPRGFTEIMMFAYKYIFLLFDDAKVIYNAQKNRLGYTSVKRGVNSFGILAGALTLKAFENSQNMAVSMIQRGYDGHIPMLKHRPFKPLEVVLSLVFLMSMVALWKITPSFL